MANSHSFREFQDSIKMVEEILRIEGRYRDPPKPNRLNVVRGLRGGASILMVGLFEYYLRRLFEEHLSELNDNDYGWIIPFNKLPFEIQKTSVYNSLDRSMKPPKYLKQKNKIDALDEVTMMCQLIASGKVISKGFSNTRNNPNSELVKEIFDNVGINKIFNKIEEDFIIQWGQQITSTFISEKLDEIVGRRHKIAHGQTLSIPRKDLWESIKFLRDLSFVLDNHLGSFITDLIISDNHYILLNFI